MCIHDLIARTRSSIDSPHSVRPIAIPFSRQTHPATLAFFATWNRQHTSASAVHTRTHKQLNVYLLNDRSRLHETSTATGNGNPRGGSKSEQSATSWPSSRWNTNCVMRALKRCVPSAHPWKRDDDGGFCSRWKASSRTLLDLSRSLFPFTKDSTIASWLWKIYPTLSCTHEHTRHTSSSSSSTRVARKHTRTHTHSLC